MLSKLLRYFAPQQIQALLEILDNPDDARSLQVEQLQHHTGVTFYERWLLRRALRKVYRARFMTLAMGTVLNLPRSKADMVTVIRKGHNDNY